MQYLSRDLSCDILLSPQTYVAAVDSQSAPKALTTLRDSLFGNLAEIYQFHQEEFLPSLVTCQSEPSSLGEVFVAAEDQLLLYVTYCQNKSRSEAIYREFTGYFEVCLHGNVLQPQIGGRGSGF